MQTYTFTIVEGSHPDEREVSVTASVDFYDPAGRVSIMIVDMYTGISMAHFTPEQARQLARTLNTAAEATEDYVKEQR